VFTFVINFLYKLQTIQLQEGERAIVTGMEGSLSFQNYMLVNGIALGTIVTKNYSPAFSQLINLTVNGKMLSLKNADFEMIEWVKI